MCHVYRGQAFAWGQSIARQMFAKRKGHRGPATTRVVTERQLAALLAASFEKGADHAADDILEDAIRTTLNAKAAA